MLVVLVYKFCISISKFEDLHLSVYVFQTWEILGVIFLHIVELFLGFMN